METARKKLTDREVLVWECRRRWRDFVAAFDAARAPSAPWARAGLREDRERLWASFLSGLAAAGVGDAAGARAACVGFFVGPGGRLGNVVDDPAPPARRRAG